jgi:hypothetical protein
MSACFVMCPSVPGNIYYIYPHHHTKFKIIILELIFQTTNYDIDPVRKYINNTLRRLCTCRQITWKFDFLHYYFFSNYWISSYININNSYWRLFVCLFYESANLVSTHWFICKRTFFSSSNKMNRSN